MLRFLPPTHQCPKCEYLGYWIDFKNGCPQCGHKLKGDK